MNRDDSTGGLTPLEAAADPDKRGLTPSRGQAPAAAVAKTGGAAWLRCPDCGLSFPVAGAMLRPDAPACHCPGCHAGFAGADAAASY